MNKFLMSLFIGCLLTSCKNEHQPRAFETVKIKEFTILNSSIRAIYGASKDTMYYAGSKGDIGYTFNNGKSWETLYACHQDTITPHFRSIAYNGKNVFALSIANPALLYKVSNNKLSLVYKEKHKKVFYDSMHFFEDGKTGIAIGDPTENCPSIILAEDGGDSWCKVSCDELPKFEEGEAFFAASNTNIKIVKNTVWVVSGGKKARVLKSTDKGKTWEVFNTPFIQGKGAQGMYSVDFYDELNGIVVGGDYANPNDNCANKAITKDGGKTWQIVSDNLNPNYKSCVKYVPNTNGKEVFAVGKTGISFSNDGGVTWKEVSTEKYYSIWFVDKNNAWLSGNNKIGFLSLKP